MGLEISIEWLTLLMFGSLLVLLMSGLPLAFVTGGLACVFLFLMGDINTLHIIPSRIFPLMTDYQLSAIPLFIFMAAMLERAGLIGEMFEVVYKLLGGVRGGLASATVVASTILAAMVGVIGAAVVTMGIIALPSMLKRHYDPKLAMGAIMAGGTLGILIPPSILAIIYAVVAAQSVGELYLGSVLPGLLLSGMYIGYVSLRCFINPSLGPALPVEERVDFGEKLKLLRGMVAPIVLIVLVLGVIFAGVATPVEAAGIGTFGAFVVAALHDRLSWLTVREACITTLKATAMVMWIIFGATVFVGLYVLEGGADFVRDSLVEGLGLNRWGILILMQVILIALGMFLDWVGILLLCVPIFVPIVRELGFDPLWFGVVYLVNMQMSFLSPPFGYALFYLRGVAPPEIPMSDIFRSALPFLFIQFLGLAICMVFPGVVTWLPRLVYGGG
jgi:tripartite ATP-independent transporter DctM subunit